MNALELSLEANHKLGNGLLMLSRSYTDPVHVGILMEPLAEYDMRSFLGRPCPTAADFNCIRQAFGCLCAAIIYLQEQEIRHKDIKPENILVDRSRVFITDFGLARDWTEGRSTTTGIVNALTHAYAAPEVLEQRPRNSSSDIWSLGCVFLDMVVGVRRVFHSLRRHGILCGDSLVMDPLWCLDGYARLVSTTLSMFKHAGGRCVAHRDWVKRDLNIAHDFIPVVVIECSIPNLV